MAKQTVPTEETVAAIADAPMEDTAMLAGETTDLDEETTATGGETTQPTEEASPVTGTAVGKALADYATAGYNPLTNPPVRDGDSTDHSLHGIFNVFLAEASPNVVSGLQPKVGDRLGFMVDIRGFVPIGYTDAPQNKANLEKHASVWRSVGMVVANLADDAGSIDWIGTGEQTSLLEAINNILRNLGNNAGSIGKSLVTGDTASRQAMEVKVRKEVTDTFALGGLDVTDAAVKAMIENAVTAKLAAKEAEKAAKKK